MKEKLKPHDENLAMKLEACLLVLEFWSFFGSEFLHKKEPNKVQRGVNESATHNL